MGYPVKMQKVQRPTNKSFYVCFPASIAEACQITKGEEMVWLIENRNTFVLKRKKKVKSFLGK
jgi:antitoxin component of MazEF toxin-antitoxin module